MRGPVFAGTVRPLLGPIREQRGIVAAPTINEGVQVPLPIGARTAGSVQIDDSMPLHGGAELAHQIAVQAGVQTISSATRSPKSRRSITRQVGGANGIVSPWFPMHVKVGLAEGHRRMSNTQGLIFGGSDVMLLKPIPLP